MTDDAHVQELLPGYLARRREELVRLDEALRQGNFKVLRTIGHNLHGSGGAYGLPRISELGRALEQAAREEDAQSCGAVLTELDTFVNSLSAG